MRRTKCCVQKHKKSLFLKIRGGNAPPAPPPQMTSLLRTYAVVHDRQFRLVEQISLQVLLILLL